MNTASPVIEDARLTAGAADKKSWRSPMNGHLLRRHALPSRAAIAVALIALGNNALGQAQDTTTSYQYDTLGNVTQITDPLSRVTKQDYDALNRLIKVTDPNSGVTRYAYDGQDHLTQVTDARNLVTSYTIDGLGNLNQTTSPDTGVTTHTYDVAGNLSTRTDAKGQLTRYQYDALNRVTYISYGDGSSATYVYDQGDNAIGRLSRVTDVSGVTQYSYDQYGRVIGETRTIGTQDYTTRYRYDSGHLTGLTYPSGRSVDYTRDSTGRISTVSTTAGGATVALVTQVAYQPFGPLRSLTFGNGQVYTRSYDLDGRVTGYTLNGQAQTVSYDAASRVTGVADAGDPANTRSYGYDQLDRITSELKAGSSLGYSYDAVGNRTKFINGAATTNYTYGADSNRLAQVAGSQTNAITIDPNGSTTGNGGSQFNYDARGRMVSTTTAIGVVSYKINALGQRVQKITPTATTVFHYDLGGKLIAETTAGATTEYVYLDDVPVAVLQYVQPPASTGPLDVSGSVHMTQQGATLNRITGKYVGSVTVANTSAVALTGPLQLKLSNLTAGLTLDNASGTDAGAPYITLSGPLGAGATVNVPLIFSNPARSVVSYTPVLYQGKF